MTATSSIAERPREASGLDYTEMLRRLTINDERLAGDRADGAELEVRHLDPKTLALVRLAGRMHRAGPLGQRHGRAVARTLGRSSAAWPGRQGGWVDYAVFSSEAETFGAAARYMPSMASSTAASSLGNK